SAESSRNTDKSGSIALSGSSVSGSVCIFRSLASIAASQLLDQGRLLRVLLHQLLALSNGIVHRVEARGHGHSHQSPRAPRRQTRTKPRATGNLLNGTLAQGEIIAKNTDCATDGAAFGI